MTIGVLVLLVVIDIVAITYGFYTYGMVKGWWKG
jgi:hypothetical protein